MINVFNLTKSYGRTNVLNDISFHINKGEVFGIVGPNGAGKSTLISIISTIIKPLSGDVVIEGISISKNPQRIREMIAYVPQEIALYLNLTVKDNLKFWSAINRKKGVSGKSYDINRIAQVVGLEERMKTKVAHLSGGMKRRLNIAVALLNDPQIIIMDEPTVGVDIISRREIMKFIKELSDQGKTIIYTSHSSEEIEVLCDRLILLNNGKLLFEGTLTEAKEAAERANIKPENYQGVLRLDDILSYLGEWDA